MHRPLAKPLMIPPVPPRSGVRQPAPLPSLASRLQSISRTTTDADASAALRCLAVDVARMECTLDELVAEAMEEARLPGTRLQ